MVCVCVCVCMFVCVPMTTCFFLFFFKDKHLVMSCSVFNPTVYIGAWRSVFEGELSECIYWGMNS